MCNNNGACRKADGRRDVPVLSRHARRARCDARARQLAAACDHRPARAGRADLGRDGRDDEALRLVQGLPPRMPDRRRHGAHEDRSAGRARRQIRALAARPAGRLPAALCALCGEVSRGCSMRATSIRGCKQWSEALRRAEHAAHVAEWRTDVFDDPLPSAATGAGENGREVVLLADTFNRYFERENLDAAVTVLQRRRIYGACRQARGRLEASALLRPHVPLGRQRR